MREGRKGQIWPTPLVLWVFQIFLVLHTDAGTTNQNEEEAASYESTHHGPAPPAITIADKEHAGAEKVKNTLSKDSLHKLKVPHDEIEVAKWDEHD